MDDISVKRALALPALLAAVTIALAAAIGTYTGVDGSHVFLPYVATWSAVTLIAIPIWMFVEVARLASTLAERPLQKVARRLNEAIRLALLPALIFPLFLGGYTWAKCSIPFAVGYEWEEFWAEADRFVFGADIWIWAHSLMPASVAPAWTYFYAMVWGFALVFSGVLIATFGSRRFAATFFTAMMLSWLLGGIIMAYGVSAAGPVFAHLANPELGGRFTPLRLELAHILADDDMVRLSQHYLAASMNTKVAVKGAGISAMPSMHIATATILVLAAWRTRWIALPLLFWLLTFFGSVYLGYHYAVDAPVAALIAIICWSVARRIYLASEPTAQPLDLGVEQLAALEAPAKLKIGLRG